ncbi:GIP [Symbiodinium sp. CCMP2592]|nr:GIP [Symbiodinium sp. CCMP2592]
MLKEKDGPYVSSGRSSKDRSICRSLRGRRASSQRREDRNSRDGVLAGVRSSPGYLGPLPVDADLRAWSHSHASFLAGFQKTPFEVAYGGKAFHGSVGISEHNGCDYLMTEHGFVEATSVRRAAPDLQLSADKLIEKYQGESEALEAEAEASRPAECNDNYEKLTVTFVKSRSPPNFNSALVYSFVRNQLSRYFVQWRGPFITDGPVEMIARTDSSVARAIAQRAGIGRVRHLQTSCLWIQMWAANKELKVLAIPTDINPADAGTKVLTGARLKKLCGIMGMVSGNGDLLQDDSKTKAPNLGNATRVLMIVQALLATQLEGCDADGDGNFNALTHLIEIIYAFGYTFSLVGGGYLYTLFGIVIDGCLLGTRRGNMAADLVLENRSSIRLYTAGLGPGYGYEVRSFEGDTANDDEDTAYNVDVTNNFLGTPLATMDSSWHAIPQGTGNKFLHCELERTKDHGTHCFFVYGQFFEHTCDCYGFRSDYSNTEPNYAIEGREPARAGRRALTALTDDELNTEVWLASSRGYAFHRRGRRNYRGSARTFRSVRMREALAMGKQPCQRCYFDVHRALHGS